MKEKDAAKGKPHYRPTDATKPQPQGNAMLHNVYFWLKDPSDTAARDKLIAGIESLRAIEVIRSIAIGFSAPTEDRDVVDASFDVSEHLVFDSVADQKIYQDHPIHRAFVKQCEGLWQRVLVYDSLEI